MLTVCELNDCLGEVLLIMPSVSPLYMLISNPLTICYTRHKHILSCCLYYSPDKQRLYIVISLSICPSLLVVFSQNCISCMYECMN